MRERYRREPKVVEWIPKTDLGRKVMNSEIVSMDEIIDNNLIIKEPQIVDKLIPNLESEIMFIGGSAGKGGGKRMTPTKRTTRMHMSGRRYTISSMVAVGNKDGYIGIGKAKSQEHRIAITKATENAKMNLIKVRRGSGSWESSTDELHSIKTQVFGKHGSVIVKMIPAPKGLGLCAKPEAKKILKLSGIKDLWIKSYGNTGSKVNYAFAVYDALKRTNDIKIEEDLDVSSSEIEGNNKDE